jgi:protein SCO1/2
VAFVTRYRFAIAVGVLVLLMAGYLLYTRMNEEKLPVILEVPDFTLTDLNGEKRAFSESDGKVRLVYFFFATCPDVCPMTTRDMVDVQNELKERGVFGSKVEFHWISIDPYRDTQEVLERFADGYKADRSGWHFLRGEAEEIVEIARGFNLLVQNPSPDQIVHQNIIALVDQKGQLRKYIFGSDEDELLDPGAVVDEIDKLL